MTLRQEILADGPLVCLPLGENGGTVATDLSGNGRNGTYLAAAVRRAGLAPGFATDFAQNQRVTVPYAAWQDVNHFTAEAWYVADTRGGTAGAAVITKASYSSGSTATNRTFWYDLRGTNATPSVGITFDDNTWVGGDVPAAAHGYGAVRHVMLTWDGTTAELTLNGVVVWSATPPPVAAGAPPRKPRINTSPLMLGHEAGGYSTTRLDGGIQLGALYGYALPLERRVAHYEAGLEWPMATLDAEMPALLTAAGIPLGDLEVEAPALTAGAEALVRPAAYHQVTLPALEAGGQTTTKNELFNSVYMPALTSEAKASRTKTELNITMPALTTGASATVPVPQFRKVMDMLDPFVWWAMDVGDVSELPAGDYWNPIDYQRLRDLSGNDYDGVLLKTPENTFPLGHVKDSFDTAFKGSPWVTQVSGREQSRPNRLSSPEASLFALGTYQPYDANTGTPRALFGRVNLWWLVIQYGNWRFVCRDQNGTERQIIVQAAIPAAGTPFSAGVALSRAANNDILMQAFINGAPATSTLNPINLTANYGITGFWPSYETSEWGRLMVGPGNNWQGSVQHLGYFKRGLLPGDFKTLHEAAFTTRSRANELGVTLPALEAGMTDLAAEPGEVSAKLVATMPALEASTSMYVGRTPAGGRTWDTATPIVRGKLTEPSLRTNYLRDDPRFAGRPYFNAWFKWTADTTDRVWFSTLRSSKEEGRSYFDTIMVVYRRPDPVAFPDYFEQVAYNDDVGSFNASQAVIEAPVLGETYYLRVGSYDNSGGYVLEYVVDNDLVRPPGLADLIVSNGTRGPAGKPGTGYYPDLTAPTIPGDNTVSAPTSIPPGEQAWWHWVADRTGRVSFDALLSQSWITGGAGTADPRVGMELWTEDQFLAYSEGHGTVTIVPRGQISWDVTAGQSYYIKLVPLYEGVNGFLRISPISTSWQVVTPPTKTFVVDATPQPRATVASALGVQESQLKYFSEKAGIAVNHTSGGSQRNGFYGHYNLDRSFGGIPPQQDPNGALNCLWGQARTGNRGSQWWSRYPAGIEGGLAGSWNGTDPYNPSIPGYGVCLSNWYVSAVLSDHTNQAGACGYQYYSTWDDWGVFLYADAYIRTWGSHFKVNLTSVLKSIRDRNDVHNDASLASISVMADEPDAKQGDDYFRWHFAPSRPASYDTLPPGVIQWGPGGKGRWWAARMDDEPGYWMNNAFHLYGSSPARGVSGDVYGYWDWTTYEYPRWVEHPVGEGDLWTPLPMDLLQFASEFEAAPSNEGEGGLTVAYLPPEINQHNPPYKLAEAFGYQVATSTHVVYGHRVLMKVEVQEPAVAGYANPLGADGLKFPATIPYDPAQHGDGTSPIGFPDPLDPGPIGAQILFGPYPVKFTPVIDVLVFGPRHTPIDWPAMETTAELETELHTQVPEPNLGEHDRPAGTVRFELPEFTLVDGIPVVSKATGRITYASECEAPAVVEHLSATPHLVDLGEDLRFPPILATSQPNTSTYRRHPTDPLKYRTTAEVTSLPSADGSVTLTSPLPGPQRVSTYAYWRGEPAATTAISFRPTSIGEESLIAEPGEWMAGDHFTVLFAAVLNDADVADPVMSPLFTAATPLDAPLAGLFFNAQSELLLWDKAYDVIPSTRRFRGKIQLLDDIRRASQPVLVGCRINNATKEVTLVAGDNRLRTTKAYLVNPIPATSKLLIGDAGTLTRPGAFDMLDMRWWTRPLPDDELLAAAAAMADLWGVLR